MTIPAAPGALEFSVELLRFPRNFPVIGGLFRGGITEIRREGELLFQEAAPGRPLVRPAPIKTPPLDAELFAGAASQDPDGSLPTGDGFFFEDGVFPGEILVVRRCRARLSPEALRGGVAYEVFFDGVEAAFRPARSGFTE
jgi:hypothetical protein